MTTIEEPQRHLGHPAVTDVNDVILRYMRTAAQQQKSDDEFDLIAACFHEAGHMTAAMALRKKVLSVAVNSDFGAYKHVVYLDHGSYSSVECVQERMVVLSAGRAAEVRFAPGREARDSGDRLAMRNFEFKLFGLPRPGANNREAIEAEMRLADERADRLIAAEWESVERFAAVLFTQARVKEQWTGDHLTLEQIDELPAVQDQAEGATVETSKRNVNRAAAHSAAVIG